MASFLSLIMIPISYYFISFRLQIYDFLSKTPSDFLNIFLKGSHGSHGFISLQATVRMSLFQLPNLIQHLLHHFLVLYYIIQVVGIEHIIPKNLVDGEED